MLAPRRLRCRALARRRMEVRVEGIVTTLLLQHRRDGSACGATACGGFRGAKCRLLGSDQLHCTRYLPALGSNGEPPAPTRALRLPAISGSTQLFCTHPHT